MKIIKLLSLSALTLVLTASPLIAQAKEQHGVNKSEKRHVTVNNSHKSSSKKHHVNNGHKSSKKYHNGHKKRHYKTHKRHRRHNNVAKAIIAGAVLHHALGPHGRYHNGHTWCPTHFLYHTHSHGYHYNSYNHHDHYYSPRRINTYIELDNGFCYKVIEYSNGEQRRKRIRDHHCDEVDGFEEDLWDDWQSGN